MSRKNRMQSTGGNPAKLWVEWKSDLKKFAYWDSSKGENGELVELDDVKFLAIAQYKTVTGFNQKYKGGNPAGTSIRANEVKDLAKETLRVFYLDTEKTVLAEGLWNDIKDDVIGKDGKFAVSVYAMDTKGELFNLKLAGAAVGQWFEFSKNKTDMFMDHWIEVKDVGSGKSGSVTYNFPIFSFTDKITRKEDSMAEICDGQIEEHEKVYFGKATGANFDNPGDSAVENYDKAKAEVEVSGADDGLDF